MKSAVMELGEANLPRRALFDGFDRALAESYTEDQWQLIAEHLAEHVQNGLT
jgi:hypothetical protein